MAGQSADSFYKEESCIRMMNEVLDYTSVMTYDFDYSGRQKSWIAYNGNFTQLRKVMEGYAAVVKDKSKLLVGLPLYGLKFAVAEDRLYYRGEEAVRYIDDLGYIQLSSTKELGTKAANPDAYDDDNGVALAYRRKFMYTFDNAVTVTTKSKWACENGYGGMMAWVASSDDGLFSLERAVTTVLNEY
ncbi:MAG: glycoside hydrolase family 18 protein, partial [Spirochaetales bacterium]|nr:glycoside hydrolase family 18 protein [Spirochaetales bacterium]